jgi:hypothetical protein
MIARARSLLLALVVPNGLIVPNGLVVPNGLIVPDGLIVGRLPVLRGRHQGRTTAPIRSLLGHVLKTVGQRHLLSVSIPSYSGSVPMPASSPD